MFDLSQLKIPYELPFNMPVGLHSPIVHFAVAIPVIIILLEFFNIFFRKKSLSVFSLFLTLLLATVMIGAYYTGVVDEQEAKNFLINAGKEELNEHKQLGIILVYASLAFVVLKLFFMLFKGAVSRILFLFISLAFTGAILKQGHDGGELVYEYGANNKALQKALKQNINLRKELENCKEDKAKESKKEEAKESEAVKKDDLKEEPKEQTQQNMEEKSSSVEDKDKKDEEASSVEEKEKEDNSTAISSDDSNNS
jgi:uncharacterized membrane protein